MTPAQFDLLMFTAYVVLELIEDEKSESARIVTEALKNYIAKAAEDEPEPIE